MPVTALDLGHLLYPGGKVRLSETVRAFPQKQERECMASRWRDILYTLSSKDIKLDNVRITNAFWPL